MIDTQEQKEVKQEITLVENQLPEYLEYKITSMAGLDKAKAMLKQIGDWQKSLKTKKETITKPLNDSLKAIRSLFAPVEDKLNEAERGLKYGILNFREVVAAKVEEKKADIVAKAESGEMGFEKAGKAVEKQEAKMAEFKTRKIKKLEIFEQNLIPREYLMPDKDAIFEAIKNGAEVAGCRIIEETIIIK